MTPAYGPHATVSVAQAAARLGLGTGTVHHRIRRHGVATWLLQNPANGRRTTYFALAALPRVASAPIPQQRDLPPIGMVIHSDDGNALQCHVCGAWKRSLGQHSALVHNLTAAEYRERYGLNAGTSLDGAATRATKARHAVARDQASVARGRGTPEAFVRSPGRRGPRRLETSIRRLDPSYQRGP